MTRHRKKRARKPAIERFWPKTRLEGGCIVWIAATTNGYGVFGYEGHRTMQAHRWLYQHVFGKLSLGVDVMHSCDNPRCVALQHLSPGTRKANMVDAVNKGRIARGERRPQAKLTEDKVREIRQRYAAGESALVLAENYGVKEPCIRKVVRRVLWGHVP